MSPFEYIVVLISIILGLGITTILTGLAELIRFRKNQSFYLPYFSWVVVVFVLHIQDWWATYELRHQQSWALPGFLLIIAYPIGLYLLAHLMFPKSFKKISTQHFYQANYKLIYRMVAILAVIALATNLLIEMKPFQTQIVQVLVLIICTTISLLPPIKSEWIHSTLAILFLVWLAGALYFVQDLQVIR